MDDSQIGSKIVGSHQNESARNSCSKITISTSARLNDQVSYFIVAIVLSLSVNYDGL